MAICDTCGSLDHWHCGPMHFNMSKAKINKDWIGVDLDGTLAEYHGWSPNIGAPIPAMVQRVKNWVQAGERVKILTARGNSGSTFERMQQYAKIKQWCITHIGIELDVTNMKDPHMAALYDDRAVAVEFNTGRLLSPEITRREHNGLEKDR